MKKNTSKNCASQTRLVKVESSVIEISEQIDLRTLEPVGFES